MVKSPIAPFSGGEKARLALALIVWQRPNLLLLDEPTNHLDLETREALTEALAQFDGTLILVSHDRHLLRATTDEFLIVADGQLKTFDGDLDDYRDWLFKTKSSTATAAPVIDKSSSSIKKETRKNINAAARKPMEKRLQQIERQMSELHQEKLHIESLLADTGIYEDSRHQDLKVLLEKQSLCQSTLDQVEAEWLQLQEAIDA
jgi:ATP-binding cassette subfamily F protein 3